ncbi:MAG: hypothetical protein KAS32_06910 [Candidatus Peribacteraceae bacterium]|nr:hypothetical protein [Candidatus Peribacteraceae bacterium]
MAITDNLPELAYILVEEFAELPDEDPTIRGKFENGFPLRRARFTGKIRKWSYFLRMVTEAEKELWRLFERDTTNFGGEPFRWVNPVDTGGQAYSVNFSKPLDIKAEEKTSLYYKIGVFVEETYPKAEIT